MSKKLNRRKSKVKHLVLITNDVLLKKEKDNKYLSDFIVWVSTDKHFSGNEVIEVLRILVERELKRKR